MRCAIDLERAKTLPFWLKHWQIIAFPRHKPHLRPAGDRFEVARNGNPTAGRILGGAQEKGPRGRGAESGMDVGAPDRAEQHRREALRHGLLPDALAAARCPLPRLKSPCAGTLQAMSAQRVSVLPRRPTRPPPPLTPSKRDRGGVRHASQHRRPPQPALPFALSWQEPANSTSFTP